MSDDKSKSRDDENVLERHHANDATFPDDEIDKSLCDDGPRRKYEGEFSDQTKIEMIEAVLEGVNPIGCELCNQIVVILRS